MPVCLLSRGSYLWRDLLPRNTKSRLYRTENLHLFLNQRLRKPSHLDVQTLLAQVVYFNGNFVCAFVTKSLKMGEVLDWWIVFFLESVRIKRMFVGNVHRLKTGGKLWVWIGNFFSFKKLFTPSKNCNIKKNAVLQLFIGLLLSGSIKKDQYGPPRICRVIYIWCG